MLEAAAQYRDALYRFVVGRVRDRAAAEDIVHDVLVRAYERQSQLRDETRLSSWLYRMTRNAIADHHRAQRPYEELPEDLVAPEAEREALQELARCLTPLIEQLPEHYRTALVMAELEGLTQQQTAAELGITLSGAKSRVQRARGKLEELIHQCCRIELDHRGSVVDYEPRHRCTTSCSGTCSQ